MGRPKPTLTIIVIEVKITGLLDRSILISLFFFFFSFVTIAGQKHP